MRILLALVVAGAASSVTFPDPADFLYNPSSLTAPVPFTLSKTLGDHMVLQRAPASAVVYGFAPAGTTVKTVFAGVTCVSR